MNWICIAVGIMRDPSVIALAEAVGVSVPTTTGHLVGVLTAMPEGAITGDLSAVSDATLEQWAMWRGPKGKFARAFRAQLCTEQGVVRSWEKYNGSAWRKLKADRERKKAERERRRVQRTSDGPSTGRPLDTSRTSGGSPALQDKTRQNKELTTPLRAVVSSGGAAQHDTAKPLVFSDPSHQAAADGYRRAHQYPAAFVATLEAVANGMHGPAIPWSVIGAALVEMQGAGARFSPATLRAFVRRLQETPCGTTVTWDDLMTPIAEVRDVA